MCILLLTFSLYLLLYIWRGISISFFSYLYFSINVIILGIYLTSLSISVRGVSTLILVENLFAFKNTVSLGLFLGIIYVFLIIKHFAINKNYDYYMLCPYLYAGSCKLRATLSDTSFFNVMINKLFLYPMTPKILKNFWYCLYFIFMIFIPIITLFSAVILYFFRGIFDMCYILVQFPL